MENAKIAKKLVAVMSECSHVGKNGLNSYHQYKYATAEDVLCKVNEALTKNKLASVVTPALDSVVDVVNLKGNKEHLVTISVKIELIDADSGESIVLQGFGSGQDAGDKAIMKAQTAAIKYAYMMSLCIATGDDPEEDGKTDEAAMGKAEIKEQTVKPVDNQGKKETKLICACCGANISEKVMQYSTKNFGKALCMDCQKRLARAA